MVVTTDGGSYIPGHQHPVHAAGLTSPAFDVPPSPDGTVSDSFELPRGVPRIVRALNSTAPTPRDRSGTAAGFASIARTICFTSTVNASSSRVAAV